MDLSKASKDPEQWKAWWDERASSTAAGAHDVALVSIADDEIVLRMEITDSERQPFGLLHGGVSMLLAESAASMHSCWGVDLEKVAPVGIEINGSHLGSAREGAVIVTGRVVKRGRTLVIHEVDVTHEQSGKHLCRARVTNLYVER